VAVGRQPAGSVDTADHGAHGTAGDALDGVAAPFDLLDDADMGIAPGSSAAQHQRNAFRHFLPPLLQSRLTTDQSLSMISRSVVILCYKAHRDPASPPVPSENYCRTAHHRHCPGGPGALAGAYRRRPAQWQPASEEPAARGAGVFRRSEERV